MLIASIAIKLSSGSPVLYKGTRVGKNKKPYTLYKFRTMHVHAEKELGGRMIKPTDQYITRVGNILRKMKIDELPQLFNVLRGDMNLVGPRPTKIIEELLREYPNYVKRFEVKPGITGLAQVNHGYYVSHEKRVALDLLYIEKSSLWLDIKIVARTAYLIFKKILLAVIHRLVFIFKAKRGIQLTFEELPYTILCFHNLPRDSLLLAHILKSARKTIKNLESSLELAPQSSELRHHLELAYLMEGKNQKAIKEREKAVELEQGYIEAVLADKPKVLKKHLLSFLEREISLNSQTGDLYYNLGIVYFSNRLYKRAASAFKQATKINPNLIDAIVGMGDSYYKLGDYQKALENFETAIQKKTDDAVLHFKVGLTLAKLSSYATAIEKFKQALAINPNFSKAQEHLNFCQYQLGWDTE